MNTPSRTNPAYAYLAYRRAIVGQVVALLKKDYTSAFGGPPDNVIVSEDVFRDEAEVPEAEIHRFINELQQTEESLRLELLKFEFVKRGEQRGGSDQPQAASSPGVGKPKGKSRKNG